LSLTSISASIAALDALVGFGFFAFGLIFGSFLNVCIYRLPRGLSVVRPGSACPQCSSFIRPYDNIPVLSWLLLRGRCRKCGAHISVRYLIVEVLTGVIFWACYARFGLTLEALKYCVLGFLLLGLIFTDAETKLLPNKLTLPGIFLGLGFSMLIPVNDLAARLLPGIVNVPVSSDISWRLLSLADALLGAAIGSGFLYGVAKLYLGWRGVEGMGFGDVKLMAMVGAFLGLKLTVFTLFTGAIVGMLFGVGTMLIVWIKRTRRRIVRNHESGKMARRRAWQSAQTVYRHYEMPFGVFLGGMALIALFFGNDVLRWYAGFFG